MPQQRIGSTARTLSSTDTDHNPRQTDCPQLVASYNTQEDTLGLFYIPGPTGGSWIRRIIVSPTRLWVMLFESSYCSSRELTEYRPYWGTKVKDKISNDFWKEIFYISNNVYKLCPFKNESDIFNTPLWFNSKLSNSNLFKKHWNSNGIEA